MIKNMLLFLPRKFDEMHIKFTMKCVCTILYARYNLSPLYPYMCLLHSSSFKGFFPWTAPARVVHRVPKGPALGQTVRNSLYHPPFWHDLLEDIVLSSISKEKKVKLTINISSLQNPHSYALLNLASCSKLTSAYIDVHTCALAICL